MTDFATAYATLSLGFASGEGREVIVEEETHVTLVEHIVHEFLIELRTERSGCQSLGLTAGEDGRTVRHGQG